MDKQKKVRVFAMPTMRFGTQGLQQFHCYEKQFHFDARVKLDNYQLHN